MSMLSDDSVDIVNLSVEAFSYQDTNGMKVTSPTSATHLEETSGDKAGSSDKGPHITQEEISRLISQAHSEGLAQGEKQAAVRFGEELAKERKRVAGSLKDFEKQCTDYYAKVEIELVHLALSIAAKILHRESQVDRMVVAGLVRVMLDRFQQNTKAIVRVRPEDVQQWTHYFCDATNLQVIEDKSLEPGGCLLETDLGIANMALDAQLKEIEQGFFDLLAQRPDPK